MDLEERARALYKKGIKKDEIVKELASLSGSQAKAEAILIEIINSENIPNNFLSNLCTFQQSGFTAEYSGLGCRGEGDFYIHHKIAELIDNQGSKDDIASTVIDPRAQDDGGVVQVGKDYITVSVDGMHSRLSHFPFLAGFHVTRAALRDTIVMGCMPKALFSDVHLANDGDVAKVFDYTAGIAAVSELTGVPFIAGSTLRIGGDLVLGDRITGCVGCVGFGQRLTPRQNTEPGDVLVMTEGSGGGTIATTALYNGFSEIVTETLNLKFISLGQKLLQTDLLSDVHSLTDVTNGGLRGDAFEIANTANVNITIFEDAFRKLINPKVLDMLLELDIDPMGVSIDSLLLILPEKFANDVQKFIKKFGLPADIVGRVEQCGPSTNLKPGVSLVKGNTDKSEILSSASMVGKTNQIDLSPKYREEPYTPIKKVTNIKPSDQVEIQSAIENAMINSKRKKEQLKKWLTSGKSD